MTKFNRKILSFINADIRSLSSLTRIALVFIVIDFSSFRFKQVKGIFKRGRGLILMLFISSFVAAYSSEIGAVDLIISIFDPRKQATNQILFTLLSGFFLSFVTGGLSTPFFIFLSQMLQTFHTSNIINFVMFLLQIFLHQEKYTTKDYS